MRKIGINFLKETRIQNISRSDQQLNRESPGLQLPYDESGELIELPSYEKVAKQASFTEVLEGRKSVREYSDRGYTLEELSYLLHATLGVKKTWRNHITLRTVPSAGARHALELFLLINNVDGLEPGLYRYVALEHKLLKMDTPPSIADGITAECLGQSFVKNTSVTFIWVAVVPRMTWRYSERGYRYLFLDAGHSCQNLYLASEALGGGTCAIGAYDDESINFLLELDGQDNFVIYIAASGRKKEQD